MTQRILSAAGMLGLVVAIAVPSQLLAQGSRPVRRRAPGTDVPMTDFR